VNILSIQSWVAAGHVGNAAAIFPLQRLGAEVMAIHTAQLSNHPGHGAFTGLLVGTMGALAHHGLTLPLGDTAGIHGGWIAILHRYPSDMAQNFWTAIFAFTINLVVTVVVSRMSAPRPEPELAGLVYSLTPKPVEADKAWYQRPTVWALAVLALAVVLNIVFA